MAFLGDTELIKILPNIIDPFDSSRVKSAHYELSLGDETFLTGTNPNEDAISNNNPNSISIHPGQFALLLTEETITVPGNMIAFISIKASQKFKGLVNISGFHVDPGFIGKLLFSVYNAGPSTIVLERKQKLFSIWFSPLSGDSTYNGTHKNQNRIPIQYIENLSGELASPNSVLAKINLLDKEYGHRIAVAEGKNTTVRWMLGIFISLLIALNIKQYYDSNAYSKGYKSGQQEQIRSMEQIKLIEKIIDSKLNSIPTDEKSPAKPDSEDSSKE